MIEYLRARQITNSKGFKSWDFSGEKFDPNEISEFDEDAKTPFFIFVFDGKIVASAHLQYNEVDGENGAVARFIRKYGNTAKSWIWCFDPLLKWAQR